MDRHCQELHPNPFQIHRDSGGGRFATVIGRTLHFVIIELLVSFWCHRFLQLMEKYERWLVGLGLLTAVCVGIVYATR
jgi:hypothetical protein